MSGILELWLRVARLRARSFFHRAAVEQDLNDEFQFHLDHLVATYIANGLTQEDARRRALREMGGLLQRKEECRDSWHFRAADELTQNLGYAVRTLWGARAFTFTVVAALTLGVGANTAIFSVVNAVLLRPLNIPDEHRLVRVTTSYGATYGSDTATLPHFNVLREQTTLFAGVSAHRLDFANLAGTDPEYVPVGRVTATFFELFGAHVEQGRTFSALEDRPGGADVVVLSHNFWRRRFGSKRDAVGQSVTLGGRSYLVVGVLGTGFNPEQFNQAPEVWIPFKIEPDTQDLGGEFCTITARLNRGITVRQVTARLADVTLEYARRFPLRAVPRSGFVALPIRTAVIGDVRDSLALLSAAVMLVLLVACANVASLVLARNTVRKREIVVRAALGASRARIVRQLLTESVLLSIIGTTVGLFVGVAGVKALLASYPDANPFIIGGNAAQLTRIGEQGSAVTVDGPVVLFASVMALTTTTLFGLVPAWSASRATLMDSMKSSGDRGAGSRQHRTRAVLAASQLAVAVMLVIGAGLLIRSLVKLRSVDPGFNPHDVLTIRMAVTNTEFETRAGIERLTKDGLQRLRALPGVMAATTSCCVPLETVWQLPFSILGTDASRRPGAMGGWTFVSPGYFDALKIPLIRGRDFSDFDTAAAPGVVIINQTMAHQFWRDRDPLNDSLMIGRGVRPDYEHDPIRQVVGIVGDVRDVRLDRSPRPTMYVPVSQVPDGITALNVRLLPLTWIVRTSGAVSLHQMTIQAELEGASGLPLMRARSMDDVLSDATARSRFDMWLMAAFGMLTLSLASVGIYGLVAYAVQQRTQEVGIRLALGATARDVQQLLMRQGVVIAVFGLTVGTTGAFGLTGILRGFLFGVTPHDTFVFVCVPVMLGIVALIATWIPVRKASRILPMAALRYE